MNRKTITANYLKTIAWYDNTLIDWANAGKQYVLDDSKAKQLGHDTYGFGDAAIISADGVYAFIYKRLGTKGLLLKNGELLREINRSYYCADVYEYPAAFVTVLDVTYLIHCPLAYNRLDFENAETGEIVTDTSKRKPEDVFHSRLEVSNDSSFLLSKGWLWHPLDVVNVYNIKDCFAKPKRLDVAITYPDRGVEICTASFINSTQVLIGSSDEVIDEENLDVLPPKHIAIWDLTKSAFSKPVTVNAEFGNLFAINENLAWDLFKYPKIIDINTGEVIDKMEDIDSGQQKSSIIHHVENYPQIVFNRESKQIAIAGKDKIEVLTPDI
ncbi:hypothetical protein [Mucilaginibacter flavidus]|uniref:hypothetical protein n=1 Tax=Mucilaginibacter flavidus TaxID=2949309 RepID=UPI002093E7C3|nr:hypothetical protein [Mucilaginibacter flavidus]MCO5946012.1 hypothetical protein [Mucilaginibacter flavidus]